MPVKWDDKMDVKFLCTILKVMGTQVSRETWGTVAAAMGEDYTLESCRLHYAKVQKEAGVENAAVPASPAASATIGTPKSSSKRKQVTDEGSPAPAKTPRKSKKAAAVKKEESDGFASEFTSVKNEDSESPADYNAAD